VKKKRGGGEELERAFKAQVVEVIMGGVRRTKGILGSVTREYRKGSIRWV